MRRATADVQDGNELDKLALRFNWICGEFDRLRDENAELRKRIEALEKGGRI
jgi:ubiquinone biosynthesis protein UbiJ